MRSRLERFNTKWKLDPESGCWIWTGALDDKGYGRMGDGKTAGGNHRPRLAHRISYEIHVGPIADGLLVCHTCDNPKCVNPAHFFLGTARDNSHDMIAKGRGKLGLYLKEREFCKNGHPLSGDNLYSRGPMGRGCKACGRAKTARHRAKKVTQTQKGAT